MNQSEKLLIRADAGPDVGIRHIMRSLELAKAWKQHGGTATFVCGLLPNSLAKQIESHGFQLYQTQNHRCDGADAKDTVEIMSVINPDWVVLDGPNFGASYKIAISKSGKLLVVDDQDEIHPGAAIVVGSTKANSQTQTKQIPAGPKYRLLSQPRKRGVNGEPAKRIRAEARHILVALGEQSAGDVTLQTLNSLSSLNRKRLVVDCFVSSRCNTKAIERFKSTAQMSVRLHRSSDRMLGLLADVDLAILSDEPTGFDFAHHGVPSILIPSTNQLSLAVSQLVESGAAVKFETGDAGESLDLSSLSKTVQKLMANQSVRRTMARAGMQLVDGKGAQRIVRMMSSSKLVLRDVRDADIEKMWQWRNDPEVRSLAFDSRPIGYDEFSRDLTKQRRDARSQHWIAENHDGQPVGMVSFVETSNSHSPIMNVIVDQTRRCRGLGTSLIDQACEKYFESFNVDQLVARFKPSNVAAEKAFRSAGFCGTQPAIIDGKMAIQFTRQRDQSNQRTIRKSA